MNPIFTALASGYTASQLLNYISNLIPKMKPQISKAQKQGYSASKIVEFLSDSMQSPANGSYETSNRITARKRAENKEFTKDLLKKGATLGATALGLAVASKAAPSLVNLINRRRPQPAAAPSSTSIPQQTSVQPTLGAQPVSPPPPPPRPTTPIKPSPTTQAIGPSPSPTPGPNIAQSIAHQASAPVEQAKHGQTPIPEAPLQNTQFDAGTFLEGIGQKQMVDALKSNNPPEIIAGLVKNKLGKNVQEAEKMAGAPIEKIISDYIKSTPPEKPKQPLQGLSPSLTPAQEPIQPSPVQEQLQPQEKPKRSLDISISKEGKLSPTAEKTNEALFPKKKMRPLTSVTYEQKYKDLSPEEIKTFRIIDDAVDKTAKHLVSGKTFQDLLPMKEDSKIQLSTAEDVLRSLVGIPSKYNLLSDEEQENVFNTFQGITPNIIWNTISLIDPRIQKVQRPNPSPKGGKQGKTEITPNDFRRMLAHSVIGMMEKEKDFGPRVKMVTSVIDMVNKFSERKSQAKAFPEFQELSDEEFSALMEAVSEEEVKKFR